MGKRVEIKWDGADEWHAAVVLRRNKGSYAVRYEADNDESSEALTARLYELEWRLLPDELGDGVYHAEYIVDTKQVRGRTQYLVKWVGYSEEDNSWEPASNCTPSLIDAFEREQAAAAAPAAAPAGAPAAAPAAARGSEAKLASACGV